MSPTDLYLAQVFGPWILIIVLVLREVVPFLRDRLFPAYLNRQQREEAKRSALDERQVQAFEQLAKATGQISIVMGTINDRTELTAAGTQRIESLVVEINTRSRSEEKAAIADRKQSRKKE